jgi:hypothetical protein
MPADGDQAPGAKNRRWYAGRVSGGKFLSLLLVLVAASAAAQQTGSSPAPASSRTMTIPGLGRGIVEIDGAWQFHLGDNPQWAQPSFDDSQWESIRSDDSWGDQGHPSYTGIAWYRRHLDIRPSPGTTAEYRILLRFVEDAYEVYWNGKPIGRSGRLPPSASWDSFHFPQDFSLTGSPSGVLAIRVWKAPLDIYGDAGSGGLNYPPQLGDPYSISLRKDSIFQSYVRQDLFDYSLVLLRVFIALLCVVLWYRNRSEQLFLWVGLFTVTPVALEILQHFILVPVPYALARFINQPLYVLYSVSLWFLLVWLLQVHDNARLVRLTRALTWVAMSAGVADGILALFWGQATVWMQWADGILCVIILLPELFPFAVIAMALRRKLDISRATVAAAAFVLQLLHSVADTSALGQRFTHWTLFSSLIDLPLFQIGGIEFKPEKITSVALFAAILFALYRYILEQQARRNALEQEVHSAQEIQQVLIPEDLPALEGYAVTSSYTPALEVGGDFFQIIPNDDGSAIVALGDVSGKGLKAGMNVSMIVGVLRAEAANTSPAAILGALNRCLVGRMKGGFATGVVFRVDRDGTVTFANAGHLPPYLNGKEFPLDASLPLGLIAYSDYSEQTLQLQPGDQLSLYTDGLLEATSRSGELFGFERMNALFAGRPTAQQASQAAIDFGQDDDITVLTLTRLAAGEESTTSLAAPVLDNAG